MADYFVSSTGSNTAPYDTWAKAATSLQTALTAASTAGDRVILQHDGVPSGDAENAGNVTYTFFANIALICSSNTGSATITPTAMADSAWIGNSTASRFVLLAGAFNVYIYGLTIRTAGGASASIGIANTNDAAQYLQDCYLWCGSTNSSSRISFGVSSGGASAYANLKNCTFRFGSSAQSLALSGPLVVDGGLVSSAGSKPSTLITWSTSSVYSIFTGVDLSTLGSSTLVGSNNSAATSAYFKQCKLGSGYTLLAASLSPANLANTDAYVFDCASGDEHGIFAYANAFGSVVSDTGIYFTSGAAAQSWKIVTTANCRYYTPFVTPWIPFYNSGTSAITPYLEILRDGSTTAYQDDEVWAEFAAKVTSGSTQATFYSDRMALAGTPANQAAGAGLGSWTGESGTAWSGKIDSGSSFTPAEVGDVSARVVVGEPSITVYVDPFVRS